MKNIKETIKEAEDKKIAVGHFNISDLAGLKAIFETARRLGLPVLIGTSEGEREFVGPRQAVALVESLREEYNWPVFLNADHTHSLQKIKEAVEAGYDAVLFDGGKLPFEENLRQTKEVVSYVRATRPEVTVEGELGYIGTSSAVFEKLPEGAAANEAQFTSVEEAKRFVEETGVDFLAPAVGNVHGMFKNAPNPRLDIDRIRAIKEAVGIPLVLHGGSGIVDEDFTAAVKAGISVVHINTEIRVA
ncbi:MAG TPA: class II fructose-bisphosphate aldolase, partial [Candidatus Tyrphobacter sp.]|nr:class II fructose-bisphosphate aldolase [Candidatus Tyrphobacter sp.]